MTGQVSLLATAVLGTLQKLGRGSSEPSPAPWSHILPCSQQFGLGLGEAEWLLHTLASLPFLT